MEAEQSDAKKLFQRCLEEIARVNKEYEEATVALIRQRTAAYLKANGLPTGSGSCFYHAHFTADVLYEQGRPVMIQAGTCSWPRLLPEQDDGNPDTPTHFTYQWSPMDAASIEAMLNGALPEMHIWCALLDSREIIDVTTNEMVIQAATRNEMSWPGPHPPDYLWAAEANFPERVLYSPVVPAVMLATRLYLERFNRPSYLTDYLQSEGVYAKR